MHGEQIDALMQFTMGLILVAFFLLTPILFYFAYKYRGRKDNRAYYYPHTQIGTNLDSCTYNYFNWGHYLRSKNLDSVMNVDTSDAHVIEVYSNN